jgi:Ala-tRNA(Pro) deacylase
MNYSSDGVTADVLHEEELFKFLDAEGIAHQTIEHKAAKTIEDIESVALPGPACKNLFLKDSAKKFWLVVALPHTKISLKELGKKLNAPELRFAQADLLKKYLGCEPGAVSLFCILNDHDKNVTVLLDKSLLSEELVGFHPFRNTASTFINPRDCLRFLKAAAVPYKEINFDEA